MLLARTLLKKELGKLEESENALQIINQKSMRMYGAWEFNCHENPTSN